MPNTTDPVPQMVEWLTSEVDLTDEQKENFAARLGPHVNNIRFLVGDRVFSKIPMTDLASAAVVLTQATEDAIASLTKGIPVPRAPVLSIVPVKP